MNEDITRLQKDVADLKAWRAKKDLQQISYPLDAQSLNILSKYFFRVTKKFFKQIVSVYLPYALLEQETSPVSSMVVRTSSIIQFSANPSTDVLTGSDKVSNDDSLDFYTTGTLPTPLEQYLTLFVINASGKTFQVSTDIGGSALDITSSGNGTQFLLNTPAFTF